MWLVLNAPLFGEDSGHHEEKIIYNINIKVQSNFLCYAMLRKESERKYKTGKKKLYYRVPPKETQWVLFEFVCEKSLST